MTEHNPYQAPTAELVQPGGGLEASRLATRGSRLAAAMLDGIVPLTLAVPAAVLINVSEPVGWIAIGLVLIVYLVVSIRFILRYGQTVGKRIVKIRIERPDGTVASLGRILFLRGAVVGLLASIPLVGPIIQLVDVLMIFSDDRRCLHDRIADTVVMQVPLELA